MNLGCADCHRGAGLGGTMYEKFGIHLDYWKATASPETDRGRADVTGDPQDLYVFKVPSAYTDASRTLVTIHSGR